MISDSPKVFADVDCINDSSTVASNWHLQGKRHDSCHDGSPRIPRCVPRLLSIPSRRQLLTISRPPDISWSLIPTDILLAELSRRQDAPVKPQCGSRTGGAYDTPLHVFALFLVFVLSTLSCGFPLISRRSSKSRKPNSVVFICQHFGTGVLIATAFVRLLPTAFVSLTDPCLPDFFSRRYRPLAGLIAMVFALLVVAVESYLTTRGGAGHLHAHDVWNDDDPGHEPLKADPLAQGNGRTSPRTANPGRSFAVGRRLSEESQPGEVPLDDMEAQGLVSGVSPFPSSSPIVMHGSGKHHRLAVDDDADGDGDVHVASDDDAGSDLEINLNELDPEPISPVQQRTRTAAAAPGPAASADYHHAHHAPAMPDEQKRMFLQCLLLEAGILFHSVFIGMALSVATGPAFVIFLIAISFHQSFEGLALGSRIAALHFPRASARPWMMVLAYGATTPMGQAIGLFFHNLYDPRSQAGLLMVGFMNAISAGLLVYAGLVQLLAEDFLTEKSYTTLMGRTRLYAFSAVVAGAMLMAAVGAIA